MKLLFDANLSPKLVSRLSGLFPGLRHVFEIGMAGTTSDEIIWNYARANFFTIVTADSDFLDLAKTFGAPPRVVRLENCNYTTPRVEEILRKNAVRLVEFENSTRTILILKNTYRL